MAKVAWNEYMKENKREGLETAEIYLAIAGQILDVYGREGDSGGPLDEANTLLGLIRSEEEE
jgi:SET and MYND domain-containing protein